jgi:hypothetical protein
MSPHIWYKRPTTRRMSRHFGPMHVQHPGEGTGLSRFELKYVSLYRRRPDAAWPSRTHGQVAKTVEDDYVHVATP